MKNYYNIPERDEILSLQSILLQILNAINQISAKPIDFSDYLDSADVKRKLNISDSTLKRFRKNNIIPFVKLQGKIFYPKSKIMDMLKQDVLK